MYKSGFTMIELLVVVLIIGVLCAIALPQYQVAVDRSRYSGLMILTRTIKDAQERFYLQNWEYTLDMRILDVDLGEGTFSADGSQFVRSNGDTFTVQQSSGGWRVYSHNSAFMSGSRNLILIFFDKAENGQEGQGFCYVYNNDSRSKRVCESLGGTAGYEGSNTLGSYIVYRIF